MDTMLTPGALRVLAGDSMRLLVSTGKSVVVMDRNGGAQTTVLTGEASDIDFDLEEKLLFFINKTDKQVTRGQDHFLCVCFWVFVCICRVCLLTHLFLLPHTYSGY